MWLVLLLVINLPIVTALQFSTIRAEDVTQSSTVIHWQTDEAGDSFVSYGLDSTALTTVGDAASVTAHRLPLTGLTAETVYQYKVESNGISDDNGGNLYSFTTLAPDTTAPTLTVELPGIIQGNRFDLRGTTEAAAHVDLVVNNVLLGSAVAPADGQFTFPGVPFLANQLNTVQVLVTDTAGNKVSFSGTIFADTEGPRLTLSSLPNMTTENKVAFSGTVSENSTIEIFLGDRSVAKTVGLTFSQELFLAEGANTVRVVAHDAADWEMAQEFRVISDTRPPTVQFELTHGLEYYEGRAETDITGETEAGATVFLYVFLQGVDEYHPNWKRALATTTADENGKFKFGSVEFPPSFLTSLQELMPREVPAGLQDILISPLDQVAQQQKKAYRVVIIAEDQTGKSGYAEKTISVNSCFSGNFAFDVSPHPDFPPTPFRLDPGLMKEGREAIAAVFDVKYRGLAAPRVNSAGEVEPGYRIQQVRFEKACTREMSEKDDYKYGCQLLPNTLTAQANPDKTVQYFTTKLHSSADFENADENIWKDFVTKRQLKMPLKIIISYQEKDAAGAWEQPKTQPFCYDLGYFVDRPIASEDLVPDFLANQGVQALNYTITKIEQVKPYLETALLVSGVTCVGSFLTKLIAKFYRFFISGFEPWLTKAKTLQHENEGCPKGRDQNDLYLQDTLESWKKLEGSSADVPNVKFKEWLGTTDKEKEHSLDERCPQTAAAWKFEALIDKAYRFTCDRFLCRPVPARWTENFEEDKIEDVLAKEKGCGATSQGLFLTRIENCQEKLAQNVALKEVVRKIQDEKGATFECFEDKESTLYWAPGAEDEQPYTDSGIYRLKPETNIISPGQTPKKVLLVYQPEGSNTFMVGVDQKCDTLCKKKTGYAAVADGEKINKGSGCYKEKELNTKVRGTKFKAGYTSDCFIDKDNPGAGLYQCVCDKTAPSAPGQTAAARTALKTENGKAEEWFYHQDRVYAESGKTAGTNYPKLRYYDGRDWSGGFGLNWGFDNIGSNTEVDEKKVPKKSVTQINPHTQYIGTFQSLCLRGIWARLNTLESTLIGLKNCIEQAKYTGFKDAGMCKTLFTQYVCGLMYKAIAYLASDCSPLSFKDVGKGFSDDGIAEFFKSGFNAIPQALDTSIKEVNDDYGDANFKQFFATGAQGFAESLCLAAFGYDFPMGMDFIRDTAYSFSTEITTLFPIAERELSSFDPVKGGAVYNYHIAGTMWPGCKIRGYRTTLKCIGPEDLGHPDVDRSCLGKGCDCLQATGTRPELASEREYLVDKGSSFGSITKGAMYELPIPSPQRVSSNFRYDHIVFDVILDQFENPESCFDKGRATPTGGRFYTPIRDITPPVSINCFADPVSGKFTCPQIASIFGGGQTYLEHPYVQCYDKRRDEFVDCDTPNALIDGDEIVLKPYLHLDGQSACLKLHEPHGIIDQTVELPENQQGSYAPRLAFGKVTKDLVQGGGLATIIVSGDSGCGGNGIGNVEIINIPPASFTSRQITFSYFPQTDGTYKVQVIGQVVVQPNYQIQNNNLVLVSEGVADDTLTSTQIEAAIFTTTEGFKFTKVFGNPQPKTPPNGQCVYELRPAQASGAAQNVGSLQLNMQMFKPGPGENCYTTKTQMPPSSLGKVIVSQPIRIQAQLVEAAEAIGVHQDFMHGSYPAVIQKVQPIVQRQEATLEDAIALYYWIASLIMQGGIANSPDQIRSLLATFFERKYTVGVTGTPYPAEVTGTAEYQKINVYLREIAKKVNYIVPTTASGTAAVTATP